MRFIKRITVFLVLATTFVSVSYAVRIHEGVVHDVISAGGIFGPLGFVALTALFVVFIVPFDIVLLVPVGSVIWGPIPTALMSISGWVLGSGIAFGIARSFGASAVENLVGMKRVRSIEKHISEHSLFWSVVFMRMFISVDVLSYALGLFSRIKWKNYMLATAIGVTPFGFYFAYTGVLSFGYQILSIAGAFCLAGIMMFRFGIVRKS